MTVQAVERDYSALGWQELKKLAKGRNVKGRRPRTEIEADLRLQDERTLPELEEKIGEMVTMPEVQVELTPAHEKEAVAFTPAPVPTAVRSVVSAVAHTRDACRIVDSSGNCIAMIYRVGLRTGNPNGERFELPMQENAEKIVKALNG